MCDIPQLKPTLTLAKSLKYGIGQKHSNADLHGQPALAALVAQEDLGGLTELHRFQHIVLKETRQKGVRVTGRRNQHDQLKAARRSAVFLLSTSYLDHTCGRGIVTWKACKYFEWCMVGPGVGLSYLPWSPLAPLGPANVQKYAQCETHTYKDDQPHTDIFRLQYCLYYAYLHSAIYTLHDQRCSAPALRNKWLTRWTRESSWTDWT